MTYGSLTLWHILSTVDFKVQSGPPHCDTSWHQKIAFYVIPLLVYISLLSLETREEMRVLLNIVFFSSWVVEKISVARRSRSHRRLISCAHNKYADFQVTSGHRAGVIRVTQEEPFPHYGMTWAWYDIQHVQKQILLFTEFGCHLKRLTWFIIDVANIHLGKAKIWTETGELKHFYLQLIKAC